MKKTKIVPLWLSIVLFALVIGVIVIDITNLLSAATVLGKAALVVDILTASFALYYCILQYKKDAAKYYKTFCLLLALGKLIQLLNNYKQVSIYSILALIELVLIMIVAFVKDLGKIVSYVIVFAILALEIVQIILLLNTASQINISALSGLGGIVVAIILLIAIYAKYVDKDNRGTI